MQKFFGEYKTYPDGITRPTDAFWFNICQKCGHEYLSCTCEGKCPECGSETIVRTLEGKSLEEVIAERKGSLQKKESLIGGS